MITRLARPRRGEKHIRAIEERTAGSAFGMRGLLIGGLSQACLHLWPIKESIFFAPRDPPQSTACQIGDHCPIAILPIQAHEPSIQGELLACEIGSNGLGSTQQLPTIIPVPHARERAYPLLGVRLQDGRACADYLTAFAPQISRSTDFVEASMGRRQVRRVG